MITVTWEYRIKGVEALQKEYRREMTRAEVNHLREIMTSEILQREGLSTAKFFDVILINQKFFDPKAKLG